MPLPGALQLKGVQTYGAAGVAGHSLIKAGQTGIHRHLESRALVEVLPDYRPEPLDVNLVVAHRRHLLRRVLAVVAWIEEVPAPNLD